MALKRSETLINGLDIEYFKILKVDVDNVAERVDIRVGGYKNKARRDEAVVEGLAVIRNHNFPKSLFDITTNMISQGYDQLKTLAEYTGAEDV